MGLKAKGTVGLLRLAYDKGLIDRGTLVQALRGLKGHNVSDRIIDEVLRNLNRVLQIIAGAPGFEPGLPWLWRLKPVLLCCMEICLNIQCVRRSDKESCSGEFILLQHGLAFYSVICLEGSFQDDNFLEEFLHEV